ncbi:hypothetical protein DK427_07000 [Methylobacterium radiodurans]|uniref:Glycosyl transferase group 1 n=2 Tax=Methylobacterium radiodurans TaxID=2202828 RepID=A0A2U8VP82_9HYPH|nr:hypothetical protein DK427_07000 [Methylobacterium radiodurans]
MVGQGTAHGTAQDAAPASSARAAQGAADRAVVAVTGRPGARCGVADYADKLRAVVAARGVDVRLERLPRWSLGALLRIRARCGLGGRGVLHIQYPSLDMGNSPAVGLAPLTIGGRRLYLTLHEFSIFGRARKLYMLPFALSRATVIFSNAFERAAFERFFPIRRCRTDVVPIGSNIAVGAPAPERARALVYFGQIGPGKGLEAFLDVVGRLRAAGEDLDAVVVGSAPDRACPVFWEVAERAEALGLRLVLDAEPDRVSEELSRARVALLPFPDGVSEKRGSAIACLEHGLAVVTTHSDKTPDWLRDATVRHVGVAETAERVRTLLDRPEAAAPDLDAAPFRALRWPDIAERHAQLYGFR